METGCKIEPHFYMKETCKTEQAYVVGLAFILRLPPMVVMLKRLLYVRRFLARPFGTFGFSVRSTFGV